MDTTKTALRPEDAAVGQHGNALKGGTPKKRFASLDFLRGLAIFMMIGLHVVNGILNTDAMLKNMSGNSFLSLSSLIVLPFLGGLAGFFLLISAASNMISMYRRLEKGQSTNTLIVQQVVDPRRGAPPHLLPHGVVGVRLPLRLQGRRRAKARHVRIGHAEVGLEGPIGPQLAS